MTETSWLGDRPDPTEPKTEKALDPRLERLHSVDRTIFTAWANRIRLLASSVDGPTRSELRVIADELEEKAKEGLIDE